MNKDQLEAQLGVLREQLELKDSVHAQELRWAVKGRPAPAARRVARWRRGHSAGSMQLGRSELPRPSCPLTAAAAWRRDLDRRHMAALDKLRRDADTKVQQARQEVRRCWQGHYAGLRAAALPPHRFAASAQQALRQVGIDPPQWPNSRA